MDFTEAYSDRCSAVGLAAREGNAEVLQKLIGRGYSVDVLDNRGWMPIHEAAAHNSSKCLRLLINAAPSDNYIHSKTFEGMSALHLSARCGSLECVGVLLEAGVDPDQLTTESNTALFLAVENGHADVVRFLIQHGASVEGSHSWSGWNSLHQAAFQQHVEIMKILLEKRANIECKDDFGITPLFVAAQYGKLESLRTLISHGADMNCQAKDRATPLLIAAQEGHAECVELLLSEGADPNLYCNEDNWQLPIHAAAEMGHKNVLKLLIPITNRICDKEKSKVSPVYSALYGGNKECLEMLLKEGYSPDAQECPAFSCKSPMCMVFQRKFFNLIDVLLNYGVTLLGINLGYCLYHEKFTLFRRFLKMGCPLPSHQELPEFLSYAVKALAEYKEWLPYLLLAGFDPVNLLYRFWFKLSKKSVPRRVLPITKALIFENRIHSMSEDVLNFILEFTNWKRLPPAVEQDLANHREKFSWTPKSHFAVIPPLSHLCRLEIRSILGSERLRSDRFIRALPLPACLQDDLLYLQLLRVSTVPGAEENLRHREEGAPSAAASSSDHTEKGDACSSPAR